MKKNTFALAFLLLCFSCRVQKLNNIIKINEVERIEKSLSADDMQGREVFKPGIDKAAAFISDEMKAIGLHTLLPNSKTYMQNFSMYSAKTKSATASMGGTKVPSENIIVFSTKASININEKSAYKIVEIGATDDFRTKIYPLTMAKENLIVLMDSAQSRYFKILNRFKSAKFDSEFSQIFVLSARKANTYSFDIQQDLTEQKLANVVGVLPGKSKKEEYVVFSGHYDHLGYGKPNAKMDSLYNGANDDASGITAVLQLAKYYKAMKNNERTLIFVAFTAEEVGGFGSQYFSQQMDANKVAAMFNIEMIGTDSKWGNNSAYITGYEKTDFGKILEKNLEGSAFKFYPDPYTKEQLFYRSDNATLARLGVPAHTISTSKMDSEPHYHQADDEVSTLNLANMTEVIKSIAISATSIVSGKDTPSRVKKEDLK